MELDADLRRLVVCARMERRGASLASKNSIQVVVSGKYSCRTRTSTINMNMNRPYGIGGRRIAVVTAVIALSGLQTAWGRGDWKITLPRRSQLSLVQRLNREGVKAVEKRDYEKAEALFYKAYLYDPADPFTLNNLGYIAEIEGQVDRAEKLYALAAEQGSDARIDLSNAKNLEGRSMKEATVELKDASMRVNRMNLDAMQLHSVDRNSDAMKILRQSLSLDPQNPFTLNNLGVVEESSGDLPEALRYYTAAAGTRSAESVVETTDRSYRGAPVNQIAGENAARLERRMQNAGTADERAAMFAIEGVLAANRNDWTTARQDFVREYSLSPENAFSLNNRGYVAEMDGDLESAQYFYGKAGKAFDTNDSVGFATRLAAQGNSLATVAADSDTKVDGALEEYSRQRRGQAGPIELVPRQNGGTPSQQQPHK
jgi:tetratricopeptide (TPR) repeat protein